MTDYHEKNLLAIDTSTADLNLAVSFGGDRLVKSSEQMEQSHGRFIIKKIGELLQSAGLSQRDLEAIVVSRGPGSFTGLRIGMAAAKGMAVALEIPVVGVSLFEVAFYRLQQRHEKVAVIIPLTKDQFYVAVSGNKDFDPDDVELVSKEDIQRNYRDYQLAGIGCDPAILFHDLDNVTPAGRINYDAADLIYLGAEMLTRGCFSELAELEPLYLQKSQAEIRFEQRYSQKRNQD
jgi:tRNA threonylcarbamoyladenosine biosynthesis protein TsaB